MATSKHHPRARGYDSWTGYWHHSNDYWQHTEQKCSGKNVFDLWRYNATFDVSEKSCGVGVEGWWGGEREREIEREKERKKERKDIQQREGASGENEPSIQANSSSPTPPSPHQQGPALEFANGKSCSQNNQAPDNQTCVYEEELLTGFVVDVIRKHDKTNPLFLFWSMHLVHYPLQVPTAFEQRFASVKDDERRKMLAMTSFLDHDVSRVVDALKESEMLEDTLIIFHADNGGEIVSVRVWS